jgi:pimeloyl-ACP methyl ester carboxylesterase
MHVTSQTSAGGVSEQLFMLGDIPGVLWTPATGAGPQPLILLAHGGGQHKQAPGVVARARHYVTGCGFAVAAIDAPGAGDRPKTAQNLAHATAVRQRLEAGQPLGPLLAQDNAERHVQAVPEWRATLDALLAGGLASDPVGFWGVSLGSAIGIPLVAAEPRISAAVFGLAGHEKLAGAAARITVPVEFLLQWDDELIPRESGLALFDAFASPSKTLHANPGRHAAIPAFELAASGLFLRRHLLTP